jgi:uncharacterized repeat protein (TIGR01451 family)
LRKSRTVSIAAVVAELAFLTMAGHPASAQTTGASSSRSEAAAALAVTANAVDVPAACQQLDNQPGGVAVALAGFDEITDQRLALGCAVYQEDDSFLYLRTVRDGSAIRIAQLDRSSIFDIALTDSGQLFGVAGNNLYRIDRRSGATASVGSVGRVVNALVVASDGTLFGAAGSDLLRISTTTGAGTVVGGFGSGLVSSGDLAFANGTLYVTVLGSGGGADRLARVNDANGSATVIGNTGAFDVRGLAGINGGLVGATGGGQLLSIDPGNGAGSAIASGGPAALGLAGMPRAANRSTPQGADLQVTKTGPTTAFVNASITYSVSVTNRGPDTARSVLLTDVLTFNGVERNAFGAASVNPPSQGTCNVSAGRMVCDLHDIPNGSTVTAAIPVGPPGVGTIVNTASVGTTGDPNPGNNSATVTTAVSSDLPAGHDLVVVKTGPATATVGAPITYLVRVTNRGPDTARSVVLVDVIKSNGTEKGSAFGAASASQGACGNAAGRMVCSLNDIPNGATVTATINVTPPDVGTLVNEAGVDTAGDPVPGNNVSTVTTTVSGTGGPVSYTALGDSYASGEGNPSFERRPFDTVSNGCHRSVESAYPRLPTGPIAPGSSVVDITLDAFRACSGAVSFDVYGTNQASGEPRQLNGITSTTDLVTIMIGGNDLQFASVLRDCVRRAESSTVNCTNTQGRTLDAGIARLRTLLGLAYGQVEKRIRDVNSSAKVFVVGYPQLFASGRTCSAVANPARNPFDPLTSGPGISGAEMTFLYNRLIRANAEIQAAAGRAGFTFVDMGNVFQNHVLCGGDTPFIYGTENVIRDNWYRLLNPDQSSVFHPNARGHEAIAQCLASVVIPALGGPPVPDNPCHGGASVAVSG